MTTEERIRLFIKELSLIKSTTIRQLVSVHLSTAPEYFFHVPASASGKYHPQYALGEGGLVRHTKAAVQIAKNLFEADAATWYSAFDGGELFLPSPFFQDAVYAALILHDSFKLGYGDLSVDNDGQPRHTVHGHPILAAKHWWTTVDETTFHLREEERTICSQIACAIASHMGQWTVSAHSSTILPLPDTWLERFVHLCDYLASRKNIEIKLEGDTNE